MIEVHPSILTDLRALVELAYAVAELSRPVPAGLKTRAREVVDGLSAWTVYACTHREEG